MASPFQKAVDAAEGAKTLRDLSSEALRELARPDERTTEYGSASYVTVIRSRSAKFTDIVFKATEEQTALLGEVAGHLRDQELIALDRIMCMKDGHQTRIRLFVTKGYARLAYMWGKMLFKPDKKGKPDFVIVAVPEWPERRVLVDPMGFVTVMLGTDYCGEVKKAGLRMKMYEHKQKHGGLGLHAGSKVLRVRDAGGKLVEKGVLLFGLSATGKTTLTCHHHWVDKEAGESVAIRQDDVVLLNKDGSAVGTEDNFYIKTEGLEPDSQPLLYKGAVSANAILENVAVGKDGQVDFFDESVTSNGRALVIRKELDFADGSIDLDRTDMVVFITRRDTIVPPIAKLTPEQAAAFFMLGESVESSAGDPVRAGRSIRVVGTNPFIIGPLEEEGNRFLEVLRANPDIDCYLLNTGRYGARPGVIDDGVKITVYDSVRLIADAARGAIKWKSDPDWGYDVPVEAENADVERFRPSAYYTGAEYWKLTKKLRAERVGWLKRFRGLERDIARSFEHG